MSSEANTPIWKICIWAKWQKTSIATCCYTEKIVDKIKEQHNKAKNLRQEAESVIAEAQQQTAEMIFA